MEKSPPRARGDRAGDLAGREAEAGGRGAAALDGMLVDAAHLRHAATVAATADLLGIGEHSEETP
ncbi:hypothetical protein LWC35_16155 [Pseudonocardia kujensis]|uniref:hypothetical protein n=1 Tax=Pseudonocardia kujensis TaxID=1128675 RepID=UPI001E3CD733|nr:hypothetical protein [Pseudonocardia kujensis]MCE0764428.1 hypothetical protein [Pseudonocardia kujensis]